jgi:Cu2+-exporting ATPase
MKTSVIEVHDMLSVWGVDEVEKRIGEVPSVDSVTVNSAAGNATVRYDETRLDIADIRSAVRQRGYQPAEPAELKTAPDAPAPTAAASPGIAKEKAALSTTPKPFPAAGAAVSMTAAPKSAEDAATAGHGHKDKVDPDEP